MDSNASPRSVDIETVTAACSSMSLHAQNQGQGQNPNPNLNQNQNQNTSSQGGQMTLAWPQTPNPFLFQAQPQQQGGGSVLQTGQQQQQRQPAQTFPPLRPASQSTNGTASPTTTPKAPQLPAHPHPPKKQRRPEQEEQKPDPSKPKRRPIFGTGGFEALSKGKQELILRQLAEQAAQQQKQVEEKETGALPPDVIKEKADVDAYRGRVKEFYEYVLKQKRAVEQMKEEALKLQAEAATIKASGMQLDSARQTGEMHPHERRSRRAPENRVRRRAQGPSRERGGRRGTAEGPRALGQCHLIRPDL